MFTFLVFPFHPSMNSDTQGWCLVHIHLQVPSIMPHTFIGTECLLVKLINFANKKVY